jgi:hypothetical protein
MTGMMSTSKWSMKTMTFTLLVVLVLTTFTSTNTNMMLVKADLAAMKAAAKEVLYIRITNVERTRYHDTATKKYYKVRGYISNVTRTSTGLVQRNFIQFRSFINNGTDTTPGPIFLEDHRCVLAYFNTSSTDTIPTRRSLRELTNSDVFYTFGAANETFQYKGLDNHLCRVDLKHTSVLSWIFGVIAAVFRWIF